MKIISFLPVSLMLIGFMTGVAMAAGETPSGDTESMVLATDTYVQGAYNALDGKKQEKLYTGNYISIDDKTNEIDLNLPSTTNPSSDGVYVLTATVTNGKPTLKWEQIDRGTRDGDM